MSSLFFRKPRPAASEQSKPAADSRVVWEPDRSLPYVIHIPGRANPIPLVCIWPKVIRVENPQREGRFFLSYVLNRDHGCMGVLLEKSASRILFANTDGHFDRKTVEISVMTDEEFAVVQAYYEQCHYPRLQTKADLVQNYIDCLND